MEAFQTLIFVAVGIFMVASIWKVFSKAGEPGWASLIPFYSTYLWIKIAGKPGWWMILLAVPLVNVVMTILISVGIAERFGKSQGYGIGLAFLGFIFYPLLGFGDARYMPQKYAKAA
jgi:hypothetical protein